jgi:hypothetical protein
MQDHRYAKQILSEIIGNRLSAVTFGVFNHLRLDFDGPSLVAWNPVSLESAEGVARRGEPGFSDRFVGCLGLTVSDVQINDVELKIAFADKCSFSLSLRDADYSSPEAGIYHSADQQTVVF